MAAIKKGAIAEVQTSILEANVDYFWHVVMDGKDQVGLGVLAAKSVPEYKRGLVFRPSLKATLNENGSFMRELIQQFTVSSVNQGAPIIIDMFNTASGYSLYGNFENVRFLVSYIQDHWIAEEGLTVKPLLRLNMATWNKYLTANYSAAVGLLKTVDILAVQFKVSVPSTWKVIGVPKWWEYVDGLIAYDADATWTDSPVPTETDEDNSGSTGGDTSDTTTTDITQTVSGAASVLAYTQAVVLMMNNNLISSEEAIAMLKAKSIITSG